MTSLTRALIIPDQKKDTLRQALLSLLLDLVPDTGAEVRFDGAAAFQSLEVESVTANTTLNKMGIKLVIGRTLNKNKNPIGENAVKELEKKILRFKSSQGPITTTDLSIILKNINSRVRSNGLSAKEMTLRRDTLTNKPIDVLDDLIKSKQSTAREQSSKNSLKYKSKFKKPTPDQQFSVGDLVLIREGSSKNKPRDTFIVDSIPANDKFILIRKLSNTLRPKLYRALPQELILQSAPDIPPLKMPKRKAAIEADAKIHNSLYEIKCSKTIFKHGWREEDQDLDLNFSLPVIHELENSNVNQDLHLIAPSSRSTSVSSQDLSDSPLELSWDNSPH